MAKTLPCRGTKPGAEKPLTLGQHFANLRRARKEAEALQPKTERMTNLTNKEFQDRIREARKNFDLSTAENALF